MRMESVIVLALCAACVYGCTQYPAGIRSSSEADELKVYYSQYVVFGTVGDSAPTPPGTADIDGVDSINFDITCMYKGTPQPSQIKIYGVGNQDNQLSGCPAADVAENDMVVMFLKRRADNYFEMEFAPLQGEPEIFIDDVTLTCGLSLTFPTNIEPDQQDPEGQCYDPAPANDCIPFDPPTTEKPPEKPVTPKKINTDQDDAGYDTTKDGQTGQVSDNDNDNGASRSVAASGILLLTTLVLTIL